MSLNAFHTVPLAEYHRVSLSQEWPLLRKQALARPPADPQELADLLKREGELKNRSEQLDELWLEQQQTLEELVG